MGVGGAFSYFTVDPEETVGEKLFGGAVGWVEESLGVAKLGSAVLHGALAHFDGSCPQAVHGFRDFVVENLSFK